MLRERRDAASLLDMLRMTEQIVSEMEGVSFNQYYSDLNFRLAIERRLEILGEAANRISKEFQLAHPEIPWRRVIGQRNFLIHEYDEIDIERIWSLTVEEVPKLLKTLQMIVEEGKITNKGTG